MYTCNGKKNATDFVYRDNDIFLIPQDNTYKTFGEEKKIYRIFFFIFLANIFTRQAKIFACSTNIFVHASSKMLANK